MDRGIPHFSHRLRFPPIRLKKTKQYALSTASAYMDPPPSYEDCAVFFYPPPTYTESVRESAIRSKQRHSTAISTPAKASAQPSASSIRSASPSSSESRIPAGLSTCPPTTSTPASSPINRRTSIPSRRSLSHTPCAFTNTSTSPSDVISRIQPRVRSWTECIRWVIQYTLEMNFRSTVAHLQCLVTEGLQMIENHEEDSEMYPIRLGSLSVPRPAALSLKTWVEFIMCMGFKFSQCPAIINNNNNNNNNNVNNRRSDAILNSNNNNNSLGSNDVNSVNSSTADVGTLDPNSDILDIFLSNANNNNGNAGDAMDGLCVIVPRGLAPQKLKKYRDVFACLLELPYTGIKTAANMSLTECQRVIALLTAILQSSTNDQSSVIGQDLTSDLPLDHTLVRSIWDIHRRPGFFLKTLDFTVVRTLGGARQLTVPTSPVAKRRLRLAKELLEMFVRN